MVAIDAINFIQIITDLNALGSVVVKALRY